MRVCVSWISASLARATFFRIKMCFKKQVLCVVAIVIAAQGGATIAMRVDAASLPGEKKERKNAGVDARFDLPTRDDPAHPDADLATSAGTIGGKRTRPRRTRFARTADRRKRQRQPIGRDLQFRWFCRVVETTVGRGRSIVF